MGNWVKQIAQDNLVLIRKPLQDRILVTKSVNEKYTFKNKFSFAYFLMISSFIYTCMSNMRCKYNPCKQQTPCHRSKCGVNCRMVFIVYVIDIAHWRWAKKCNHKYNHTHVPSPSYLCLKVKRTIWMEGQKESYLKKV